jgi:transposase
MRENDARIQSLAELHERRKQVIRLHKKQYGVMQIVELTGLSWPAVRTAIDLYEAGGMAALKPKPRGRKSGEGRKLSTEQEAHIQKLIVEKRPEQLKMEFALWTRAAVGQLIEAELQIKLSVRGVGKYLKRWGFTPQKPIKRAYEQSPEAIKKWLNEEYPAIAAKAKAQGGEIHWGDETALVNTHVHGRSYAPKGQTPVTLAPGARQKLSMISTVTNKGEARWMIIDGNFNADRLIEFLEALIKDGNKKGVSDPRQSPRPSFEAIERLARQAHGPYRSLLPPELCAGTEPRRAPERRYEARHRSEGPRADKA